MENNELHVMLNKMKKEYYNMLIPHYNDYENFKEFNNDFNNMICRLVYDFIRLHQTIIEKNTFDYDICTAMCEIGMNGDVYQVQLCAIGNKNLWIKEVESITITSLTKKS